ncbi:MAG: glycosyltransferase, partial [Pedobacter sp.]
IHIHYGLSALFLLFFRPKKKIFVTFHGADILKEQGHYIQVLISKYIAKKVDKVFILNDEMEVIMKKLKVPYEILPCGVDTDFFKDTVAQNKPDNSKLLLFSGDPERTVKNYPLFEKIVENIKTKTNTNILVDCVHNKNREQVREILNQADCLVMTSFSEGSPQIVKEALSCNLPVVSVPVGDIPTVINGISSCYAASGHHANELADLTLLAIENRSNSVREEFLNKKLYENKYICSKIYQNYINN